jgi:phenylacetate-CoA ligase
MIESLYPKLPIFMQNLVCSIYGLKEKRSRFNKDFFRYLEGYQKSQFFSAEQISEEVAQSLRQTLVYCQNNVPYYTAIFAQFELDLTADNIEAELLKLPVMTKEVLRLNGAEMVSRSVSENARIELHTSGTTGKALTLFKDKAAIAKQWAIWFRHRTRFEAGFGDLHVNFTGKLVVPREQLNPPFWRFNRPFNQYLINMQHVNDENIKDIVGFLNSISPKFYSGYPSIIAEVARLALEHDLPLNASARPNVIFAGAENTLDYQKSNIEAWTGAVVTDQYGLTEGNCNLSRCEFGLYHIDHEFGFVECVDPELLSDGRKKGRLIGTSFTNFAMPMLRYDTGDVAIWKADDFKCPCGRHTDVIESIEGRIDDFVQLNDGRRIMRFDYLFKGTDSIKEAQICQYKLGEVVIKLVSRVGPNEDIENELKAQFVKWITNDMDVNFEYLEQIPKSNTGKFKAVQSFL